jgi:hypothetical protein
MTLDPFLLLGIGFVLVGIGWALLWRQWRNDR